MTRPRVSIYHDLEVGGALRAATEFCRETTGTFDYHAALPTRPGALAVWQRAEIPTEPVSWPPSPIGRLSAGSSARRGAELLVSSALDRRASRVLSTFGAPVLVHPSNLLQAPGVLRHLRLPTIYYAHEPRRRTFEKSYNRVDSSSFTSRVKSLVMDAFEPWLRYQDKKATLRASAILCNSEYTRKRMFECYGVHARVVHPGVDTEFFTVGSGQRHGRVLSVGGLEPSKGHDLLIRAVGLIDQSIRPDVTIVGDRESGNYGQQLRQLAAEQGVNLEIRSAVGAGELVELYQTSAVTFCGASAEPLGLTPLESMACGTPVVAVAAGGYLETVTDGVSGRLIANSPIDAARAIESLISEGASSEIVRGSILPYWSWDAAGDRIAHAIEEILATPDFRTGR